MNEARGGLTGISLSLLLFIIIRFRIIDRCISKEDDARRMLRMERFGADLPSEAVSASKLVKRAQRFGINSSLNT